MPKCIKHLDGNPQEDYFGKLKSSKENQQNITRDVDLMKLNGCKCVLHTSLGIFIIVTINHH